MTIDNVSVALACGHTQSCRLPVPDPHWCESCDAMMPVQEVREYRAHCLSREACGFASYHGGALILAQNSAKAHADKTGHRVGVYYGARRVTTAGTRSGEPERESLF